MDPSLVVAIAVFAAYVVVVSVLWAVNRVDYPTIGASRGTVVRGIVVPIGVGGALLAVTITVLGWWDEVLFQSPRSGPTWAWVVPALLAAIVVVRIVGTVQWRSPNTSILPILLVGTAFVGFAEEALTRGIVIVGLRADLAEVWVWVGSCVLFGLLHGINAFFGQSTTATLRQVVIALLLGSSFYVTRQVTGVLFVGMALHALWDFGALGTQTTGGEDSKLAGLLSLALLIAGVAAGWFVTT